MFLFRSLSRATTSHPSQSSKASSVQWSSRTKSLGPKVFFQPLASTAKTFRPWSEPKQWALKRTHCNILLMVQKSGDHHLGCINSKNNGTTYQPQLVKSGCLNHQQYPLVPIENIASQKETIVFQTINFQGRAVSFRGKYPPRDKIRSGMLKDYDWPYCSSSYASPSSP